MPFSPTHPDERGLPSTEQQERRDTYAAFLPSVDRTSQVASLVFSTQTQQSELKSKFDLASQQILLRRIPPPVNISIPLLSTTTDAETIVIVVALVLTLKSEGRVLIAALRESIV